MTPLDRARLGVPAILAAAAGGAAAGVVALIRAGVRLCDHRLLASHAAATASDGMPAGMTMPAGMPMALPPVADGACPILLYAGLVAAALCVLALVVLLASAGRLAAAALAAVFRLLAPGSDTPWAPRRALVPIRAGVRIARRRPSRAPPVRA